MAEEKIKVQNACYAFPGEFYLKGQYPSVFRVNSRTSYLKGEEVILAIYKKEGSIWVPYAEGTAADLKAAIQPPGNNIL
jgi:hypothetical protein